MRGLRPYCRKSALADHLVVELVEQADVAPERLAVEELPGGLMLVDRILHAPEEYLRDVLSQLRAHGFVTEALETIAQSDAVVGHGLLDRDLCDADSTSGLITLTEPAPGEQTQR